MIFEQKYLNKIKKHKQINKKLFTYYCVMLLMKMMYYNYLEIFKKTKKLDCLINNVGVAGPTGTIEKLSFKDWEKTIKINVIESLLLFL